MASGGFLTVETLKFSQATASYVAGIPSGETCYDLQMNYEDTLGTHALRLPLTGLTVRTRRTRISQEIDFAY